MIRVGKVSVKKGIGQKEDAKDPHFSAVVAFIAMNGMGAQNGNVARFTGNSLTEDGVDPFSLGDQVDLYCRSAIPGEGGAGLTEEGVGPDVKHGIVTHILKI